MFSPSHIDNTCRENLLKRFTYKIMSEKQKY